MVDISDHVPPHCYFIRLHLGPIPGPSEWSASLTRKGQVACIENARGNMHARSVKDAAEFQHVLASVLKRMGFITTKWERWTPNGFRVREFTL